MTTDKTPSPTDAEAWALWTSLPLTGSAIQSQGEFARAVLAKWGSPVVATKVSIPTHTMEQEFQNHYRRGFEAGKKAATPQPTQAQAGAVDDDRERLFWEACQPHGKVGEVVYLTYKTKRDAAIAAKGGSDGVA